MHFDGSKMKNGLGAGIILTSPKRDQLKYVLQIHFAADSLVHGLKVAKEIGIRRIQCFGDSDLVAQQVSGIWDALDANMALYRFHVQQISRYFDGCEFHHVPRAENEAADTLSKLGSSRQAIPSGISLEHLRKPSIKPSPESESIFIPANPEPDVVPMDLDVGNSSSNPGTSQPIPGTAQLDPGTSQPMSAEAMMIDEAIFTVRAVPSWA